jgi:hypothetical protein
MNEVSEWIVNEVNRQLAEMEATADLPPTGRKRIAGQSIVYSIRLDPDEVTGLEHRATLLGIKPTVLARNLIRIGLAGRANSELSDAVDRVIAAAEELRAYVP